MVEEDKPLAYLGEMVLQMKYQLVVEVPVCIGFGLSEKNPMMTLNDKRLQEISYIFCKKTFKVKVHLWVHSC